MSATLFLAVADSKVRPGWIAFLIVIGLCVATVVLWRSMNRQLRKISVPHARDLADDDTDPDAGDQPPDRNR
jgi:Na+/proline symporter